MIFQCVEWLWLTLSKWRCSPIFSLPVVSSLLLCAQQWIIFSESKVIMARNMVVSLVVVVFITVVFAGSSLLLRIASIRIILCHMRLQLQRLSFNHQLLCKNVVLNTSHTFHHFWEKRAETIKMAEDHLFICWCKLFTLRCLRVKNFFRLLNYYGCKYGYKSCCGCLYYSCLCMVVFVIVHCHA